MAINIHCPCYARAIVGASETKYCYFNSIIMQNKKIFCVERLQRSARVFSAFLVTYADISGVMSLSICTALPVHITTEKFRIMFKSALKEHFKD